MPIAAYDRVRESTTTTGTGTITLAGVAAGPYQSFAVVGNGNQCIYCIADQAGVGNDWEVGVGTYSTTGPSLARTTVLQSSNSNALVNFPAGAKDVFVVYAAGRSVDLGDVGTAPNQVPLNQYLGKLAFQDVLDTISNNPYQDTQISDVEPTLNLDFVNSKTLDPRITFTRGSPATYYDGKTSALAEQNLLLQSQALGTSPWTYQASLNPTTTNNADTAPDGTTTATSLVFSAQYQNRVQSVTLVVGLSYTISFYVKTTSGNTALTIMYDGGSFAAITTTASWARYSYSFTATTTSGNVGLQDRNASGFGTTLVWGAQLEQRASATAYNATTTQAITNYIPVLQTAPNNVARLDYNPVTGTPNGLLIEEARTNLLTYSSDFSNAAWSKQNSTITATANIAPDGTQTAFLLTDNATNSGHYVIQNQTSTVQSYTLTVYAKAYQLSSIMLYNYSQSQGVGFNLSTGQTFTVSGATLGTGAITLVGNGWYRCSMTYTGNVNTGALWGIYAVSGTSFGYAGTGQGVYIWGAQFEAGAFPTSYIPTVASQVTRSADVATMPTTGWFNQAQGSFYAGINRYVTTQNNPIFSLPTSNNSNFDLVPGTGGTNFRYGASADIFNGTALNSIKAAASYNAATPPTRALSTNGIVPTVGTSANTPIPLSPFYIGYSGSVTGYLNGWVQKISYYPQALSNAELQEMTS